MQIELLAKNIVRELVESGALQMAVTKATGATPTPPTKTTGNFTPDQKLRFSLRGDVMNLAGKISEKYGIETRIIFGELKRRTGVSQPEATPEQLSERVDLLQRWLQDGRL